MQIYQVELEGLSPLMHHRMSEEALFGLLGGKKTDKKKPKQVLTPRQIANDHAYKAKNGSYYIPLTYVAGALIHVAGDYRQKDSSRKSMKTIIAGCMQPIGEGATLLDKKNKPIKKFEVDVRKGTNHLKGAVCVCRPRFDEWKVKFDVRIDDTILPQETGLQMLEDAGRRAGIGSFRICKSGPFGSFQVTKWKKLKK